MKNKKSNKKNKNELKKSLQGFGVLALLAFGGAMMMAMNGDADLLNQKTEKVAISELVTGYNQNKYTEVTLRDNKITAKLADGTQVETYKEPGVNIADLGLNNSEIPTKVTIEDTSASRTIINLLVGLLPFLLIIGLLVFMSRKAGGMTGGEGGPFGFGKSRAKVFDKTKKKTKFSDVAGIKEAKEEVTELVDFLKFPKKYQAMGAKIPKGIIMVGQPGTGKTLMARAIAGEAGVPFYSVSGSEFVEMFVGVGASRVRDLFKTAKKNAPSIIFIDEIDAIGKKRGNGTGGGHDEREQTLNQILTEMDGFEPGQTVIVIAATNRPDVLDKALMRPGRFDRRVYIDLPDMEAREEILKLHSRNKPMSKKINLNEIASKTVGFSGADLENVLNEGAILAVKNRKKEVVQEDLNQAVEKVSLGPEKKSRRINAKERDIVAYHEVGHAIAGHFTTTGDPVHKITIIPRGGALGLTWFLPEEDTYLKSEQRLKDEMVSLHGGRVAEDLIFGEMTTGASNDLERITKIAKSMVMRYGMGGETLGPVVFEPNQKESGMFEISEKEYSQDTSQKIDAKVRELVKEAENRCREILTQHQDLLKQISKDLLEKENIYREEFLGYFS